MQSIVIFHTFFGHILLEEISILEARVVQVITLKNSAFDLHAVGRAVSYRNATDQNPPNQREGAKPNANPPVPPIQRNGGSETSENLNHHKLQDPLDSEEKPIQPVGEDMTANVPFTIHFLRVKLVEQLQHYKCVEQKRQLVSFQMLRFAGSALIAQAGVGQVLRKRVDHGGDVDGAYVAQVYDGGAYVDSGDVICENSDAACTPQ